MGELTVTGLDEAVLPQLSRLAEAHGRSLDQEASSILAAEIARNSKMPQMSEEEWLAKAAETRRKTGRLSVQSIDFLHESRDER